MSYCLSPSVMCNARNATQQYTEKTPENNRRQAQIKFNEKICRVI